MYKEAMLKVLNLEREKGYEGSFRKEKAKRENSLVKQGLGSDLQWERLERESERSDRAREREIYLNL